MNEILTQPRYEIAESGRIVGMTPSRVRRWVRGYRYSWEFQDETRTGQQGPVVRASSGDPSLAISFLDLVGLMFVKAFLDQGLTLQRVRKAMIEVNNVLDIDYPFSRREFFTDGHSVWVKVSGGGGEHLLELFSGGQWVIAPVILSIATKIAFDAETGMAAQYWPLGKRGHVVLDPRIAFGAPVVAGRGIKTTNINDFFLAEGRNIGAVTSWFGLRPEEANGAVEFEHLLRVA